MATLMKKRTLTRAIFGQLLLLVFSCIGVFAQDRTDPEIVETSSISVVATSSTMIVGGTLQLHVFDLTTQTEISVDPATTYSSSDPTILTVSSQGLITGVGPGKVLVQVTNLNLQDEAEGLLVTVNPADQRFGDGIPDAWKIAHHFDVFDLTTQTEITVDPATTYSSSDPTILTVSSQGLITGVGPGKVLVQVTNLNLQDEAEGLLVTVNPADQRFGDGIPDAWKIA